MRFCDRLVVNERILGDLQVIDNEGVVDFCRLENPRKGPKMDILRG